MLLKYLYIYKDSIIYLTLFSGLCYNQISKYKEGQINAEMELYIYIEYNQ